MEHSGKKQKIGRPVEFEIDKRIAALAGYSEASVSNFRRSDDPVKKMRYRMLVAGYIMVSSGTAPEKLQRLIDNISVIEGKIDAVRKIIKETKGEHVEE